MSDIQTVAVVPQEGDPTPAAYFYALMQERDGHTWVAPLGSGPEGPAWIRLDQSGLRLTDQPVPN